MKHRINILHRLPRHAAVTIAVAIAVCGTVITAQSLDTVLEDLVEEQIEQQVESELIEALERQVEAGIARAGAAASHAVSEVVEPVHSLTERFYPDVDPAGRTIERGVWVILAAPEHADRIEQQGFRVRELRRLEALDRVLIRVEAPGDRDLAGAAHELALEAPGAWIDLNHVYRGVAGGGAAAAAERNAPPAASPTATVAIGIVDSAVAVEHEALRTAEVEQHDFVPYDRPRPTAHGTAVASILVGDSATLRGALRGARLRAASVFFEDDAGASAATTASLVQAIDWLVASGVRVINMSLAGPPNRVLEATIQQAAAAGIVVVAAVGNNGPVGEPLYPAAYEPVVGITAVDSRNRVYRSANRGRQVTFAAPGVAITVAQSGGGYGKESGTSIAAPYAAAMIARSLVGPGKTPERVLSALKTTALDLGEAGFDETFGFGLIATVD